MKRVLLLQLTSKKLENLNKQQMELYLDEIGDMSLNAQAKVLRATRNQISRVGGNKSIKVNPRIIAA